MQGGSRGCGALRPWKGTFTSHLKRAQVFALLGVHEFLPSVRAASWMEGQLCAAQPELCVR